MDKFFKGQFGKKLWSTYLNQIISRAKEKN